MFRQPPDRSRLISSLFQDVDRWSFDVFALNSASCDHALQTLFFELVTKYQLNSRFKVFPLYCSHVQTDRNADTDVDHTAPLLILIVLIDGVRSPSRV